MKYMYIIVFAFMLFAGSCQKESDIKTAQNSTKKSMVKAGSPPVVKEIFTTQLDTLDNIDSPGFWQGPEGKNWLLATAKDGNKVIVYDAATGKKMTSFGQGGNGPGELDRPNGIAVVDSVAFVVERDNHRIQLFALPSLQPLGIVGEKNLRRPYGISVDSHNELYHLYVTDNYENPDESIPAPDSLGHRVHHFTVALAEGEPKVRHIRAFGDTEGKGVLYKVESILMDRTYNRLLIADEFESQRNIKIYTLEGSFTGDVFDSTFFAYEPEGITLWSCSSDSSGYYIATDQDEVVNTFQVFDRKTLEYCGGFTGEITRNTDGVALTQAAFGPFSHGVFYPVHNDGSVSAIAWNEIASALNLRVRCN